MMTLESKEQHMASLWDVDWLHLFTHPSLVRAHFRGWGSLENLSDRKKEIRTKNLPKKILLKHLGGAILFNILCINYK